MTTEGSGHGPSGGAGRDTVGAIYMDQARQRLAADGNKITEHAFTYGRALVASQKLTLWYGPTAFMTFVVAVKQVTPELLDRYVSDVVLAAQLAHGSTMSRGLSVIAVMASGDVTPEARAAALGRRPAKYGIGRFNPGLFLWPAVADLVAGEALYYTGSFLIGRFGSGRVLDKLQLALGPLCVPR